MEEATRETQYIIERSLYLALELSKTKWKLGFSTGLGQHPRKRIVDAGELPALRQELEPGFAYCPRTCARTTGLERPGMAWCLHTRNLTKANS